MRPKHTEIARAVIRYMEEDGRWSPLFTRGQSNVTLSSARDLVTDGSREVRELLRQGARPEDVELALTDWLCTRLIYPRTLPPAMLKAQIAGLHPSFSPVVVRQFLRDYHSEGRVWLTGGRAVVGDDVLPACGDQPQDWDVFVMTYELDAVLASFFGASFVSESGEHYSDALHKNRFVSLRSGLVNLIVTDCEEFADRHERATRLSVALGLRSRSDRLLLFRTILYDELPS